MDVLNTKYVIIYQKITNDIITYQLFSSFLDVFETKLKKLCYTGSLRHIQGDSDVFSIKQNLNSLHQGEHRFSHAFFTKVLHFRDNHKNVQF